MKTSKPRSRSEPRVSSGTKARPIRYDDAFTCLREGDAFKLLKAMPKGWQVDHLLSDPPYGARTHEGARTARVDKKLVNFPSFTFERLVEFLELVAPHVARWAIFTCDDTHAARLKESPPKGWRHVRTGVWVKPGAAPQFTGDRPGQGWEAIVFLHREDVSLRWNGGGRHSVFNHPVQRGLHPTQKPLGLYAELVKLFTDVGESVLDPFCGSGTTLVAAKQHARKGVGFELNPEYAATARSRLRQHALDLGGI